METAALGFRVKSGWAMAVLIGGSASEPVVVDRRRIELADASVPESIQPFHAALDLPKAAGAKVVARLVKVVETYSQHAMADLMKRYRAAGHRITAAGIVVGSIVDPKTIKNDHIRAHAEEGRLFRVAVHNALKMYRLTATATPEKELIAKAVKVLGTSEQKLKAYLVDIGKPLDGSWRAEDKTAALAAWLALKDSSK